MGKFGPVPMVCSPLTLFLTPLRVPSHRHSQSNMSHRFSMPILLLGCATLLLLTSLASLLMGAGDTTPWQALSVLLGAGTDDARFVLFELRLPRTWVGLVTGMALGCAGALMQTLARNPLAEPGLLGVSAGSAFAVTLALLLGASSASLSVYVAQAGALAGCLIVLSAARLKGVGNDPIRLVLAGATLRSEERRVGKA